MKEEVQCACELFSKLLETRNLPRQFVQTFRVRLSELLSDRFREHWDVSNPTKGSGYRCIRINSKMDPIINDAAKATGLQDISKYLPVEFTMWIDPGDVSYRIGEDGSVCSLPTNLVRRSESATSYVPASPSTHNNYSSYRPYSPPSGLTFNSPPFRSSSSPACAPSSRRSPTSQLSPSTSPPYYHHQRNGQGYPTRSSPVSTRLIQVQV